MNSEPSTITKKVLTLAGVIVFSFAAVKYSALTILTDEISFVHSREYAAVFEQHFWQFAISFLGIIILSRGNLWSYGINSNNLNRSMKFLMWLYIFSILMTVILVLTVKNIAPIPNEKFPAGLKNSVLIMLIYWMSAPVAHTILFFGFGETLLLKQWGDSVRIFGFPLPVIVSAVLFTLFSTATQIPSLGIISFALDLMIGGFCGYVYWKTQSLITPMLAHAFFFGFPILVEIVAVLR